MTAPDAGFEHDPDDPDEADLVASMHGRPGTEIQNAINDLRARKRGQSAGIIGPAVPQQPPTPPPTAQPSPRDGVIGGKPVGKPEPTYPNADQDKQDGLRFQAASEEAMAAAGYRVERGPVVRPEERLTLKDEDRLRPGEADSQGRIGPRKTLTIG